MITIGYLQTYKKFQKAGRGKPVSRKPRKKSLLMKFWEKKDRQEAAKKRFNSITQKREFKRSKLTQKALMDLDNSLLKAVQRYRMYFDTSLEKQTDRIRALLERGADPDVKNEMDISVSHIATWDGWPRVF